MGLTRDCWRLRFTIRDLVLVTTAAAMALGFWVDHCRLQHKIKFLEQTNERKIGGGSLGPQSNEYDEYVRTVLVPQRSKDVERLISEFGERLQPAKIDPADYDAALKN